MVELLKHQTVERKLIDSGLIALSLIIMQDWIATGTPDLASFISLIAFAGTIPMLASDLLILQMPKTYYGKLYFIANHLIGMILAFVGVGAAIFHVSLDAGVGFLVSCVLSYAGYALIYKKNFTEKIHRRLLSNSLAKTERASDGSNGSFMVEENKATSYRDAIELRPAAN